VTHDRKRDASDAPRKKVRRSLTHVGGRVDTSGDSDAAHELARAFDVSPARQGVRPRTPDSADAREERDDEPARAHVHGFHAYPARMHPLTAARLVTAFSEPGGRVLDPFCGSGTVLVEAMLAGRTALGVDLNPFAVALARLKTSVTTADARARMLAIAEEIAVANDARRKQRAGATRRFPKEDTDAFEPHILLELDGIRALLEGGVQGAPKIGDDERSALFLVLSAILTKVSKRRADTSESFEQKRIAAGYPTKLFVKKTRELAERLATFAGELPANVKRPRIVVGDATKLDGVADESIDAIITSPPYAGTYDYLAHHAMRLRWLGLPSVGLEKGELGARRDYARLDASEARRRHAHELGHLFAACARVSKKDGALILLMADSATRTTVLHADAFVDDVARAHGAFVPVARASQLRPHFHGPSAKSFSERPRAEHLLLLRRA
jgi:DNA modification methylase